MRSTIKVILPIVALLLLATLVRAALVPGRHGVHINTSPPELPTETLFRQKCSKWHGVDGTGDTSLGRIFNTPDFTDSGWWTKHSNPRELVNTITRGKKNMPAFRKKLTKAQISSLAGYVQRFKR